MTHKQKVALARRLLTPAELKGGVPKFNSRGWTMRKMAIKQRVEKRNSKKTDTTKT